MLHARSLLASGIPSRPASRVQRLSSPAFAASALFALAGLLAAPLGAQASEASRVEAGRVVFALGNAQVVNAAGERRPARPGETVAVGERVVTGAEAHVHLRMVDDAFVAVRPGSTLAVDLYDYDAAAPQASRIRLNLHDGNTRTVSGRGGEAAKDRYRFNTPVAAIGLRGTDYTVRNVGDETRVSVSSGAVAVTPLGADCMANALGPCSSALTRELAAGVPHAYLQVSAHQPAPVLVAPEQDPRCGGEQNPASGPPEPRASSGERNRHTPIEAVGEVIADRVIATRPSVPPVAEAPAPVEPPPVVVEVPQGKVVWGRWSAYAAGSGSAPFTVVLNDEREVLYSNEVFGLARDKTTPVAVPRQGEAGFRLDRAEAYLLKAGGLAPASVTDGRLNINFDQRRFDTALTVSHAGGVEKLGAAGGVSWNGQFRSDAASDMTVRGALSRDATEAAYLFEKAIGAGDLVGAVRWLR